MKSQMKTILFSILPLVGALCTSPVVSADDREYDRDRRTVRERDRDIVRVSEQDLRSFEAYLDSDWQTANLLYQNPALINDRRFARNHPALHDWLEDHSDMAAAIQANPDKFLWRQRGSNVQDFFGQLFGNTQ